VPETSRSLHYWQPAPSGRLLPWLANPGNPHPFPLLKQWKEGRKIKGVGGALRGR